MENPKIRDLIINVDETPILKQKVKKKKGAKQKWKTPVAQDK